MKKQTLNRHRRIAIHSAVAFIRKPEKASVGTGMGKSTFIRGRHVAKASK